MRPAGPLHLAYLSLLWGSTLATVPLGYWVAGRDVRGRREFLWLLAACVPWAGLPAVALLVAGPAVDVALAYGRALFGIVGVFAWFTFATAYTNRSISLRSPPVAAALAGGVALVVALVTNPLHGLYWSSVTVSETPFAHVVTPWGPLGIARNLWAYAVISTGLYYLIELFVKSRHRSSLSVAVLFAGSVAASLPNLLTFVGAVPLVGYDHTPVGIVPFAVATAYAVFALGLFDLRPVARDELIDQVDDTLLAVDDEGTVVDANAASARLLDTGRTPVGRPLSAVAPELAERVSLPDVETGTTAAQVALPGDDGRRYYSVVATALTDGGTLAGHALVLRDVTELESYKRELERQNEQLERFASTVTHDLRNPLQVVMGRVNHLERTLDDGDQRDDIAAIESSLDRMEDIISDLRTLARKGKSVEDTEPVGLTAAVNEAWGNVDMRDATFEITTDGTVHADRGRLLSILENLFRNAVEHAGDDVALTVGLVEDGFHVADDGPGIPESERETVFEYGVTSARDGTGLGLSIVRTMAESHGWSVRIDEDYRVGARFVFEGATVEPDPAETPAEPERASG